MSEMRDFSGGPVVKSLPANVGDRGSTPGPGAKSPHATGRVSPWTLLFSLCSPAHARQPLKPALLRACILQQEKPHNEKATRHN